MAIPPLTLIPVLVLALELAPNTKDGPAAIDDPVPDIAVSGLVVRSLGNDGPLAANMADSCPPPLLLAAADLDIGSDRGGFDESLSFMSIVELGESGTDVDVIDVVVVMALGTNEDDRDNDGSAGGNPNGTVAALVAVDEDAPNTNGVAAADKVLDATAGEGS